MLVLLIVVISTTMAAAVSCDKFDCDESNAKVEFAKSNNYSDCNGCGFSKHNAAVHSDSSKHKSSGYNDEKNDYKNGGYQDTSSDGNDDDSDD